MNSLEMLALSMLVLLILFIIEIRKMKKDIDDLKNMSVGLNIILHKKFGITTTELAKATAEYFKKGIELE